MSRITTNVKLELLNYGQQRWDISLSENAVKLDDILETFPILWNQVAQQEGGVLCWNSTSEEWETMTVASPTPLELTDQAEILTDASVSEMFTVTLEGNRFFKNPTNIVDGKTYYWVITQDSTGNRTATFGSDFGFPSGPITLSTGANRADIIKGVAVGSLLFCTITQNYDTAVNYEFEDEITYEFEDGTNYDF